MKDSDQSASEKRSGASTERHRLATPRLWVLLKLNRWVFAGVIVAILFAVVVAGSQFGLAPLRQIIQQHNGTHYLFSAFIGAIITGVSIVVTINQLVLSQELGAAGDQRERMTEAMSFRRDIEDQLGEGVTSPEPAGFLFELLGGVERQATRLAETTPGDRDPELRDRVDSYATDLANDARTVMGDLEDAQFGTFEVIWSALDFNYSRKIFEARRLRDEHADSLSNEATEEIDDTIELLTFFGPAREHFKTLYFQWELINLSRALLFISLPALALMAILLMYVDQTALPGTTLGVDNLVWVASAGVVAGIAPFVVFVVYLLRIASVAKRTLAMGPFILTEKGRDRDMG